MSAYTNTIKSLSERVLRGLNLGGIPRDSRFELRDIEYMLRDGAGKFILKTWSEARAIKERLDVDDSFISTVKLTVQETPKKQCYVDLNFDWIIFPDGSGIQSCRPSKESVDSSLIETSYDAFIPVPARFDDIYRNLPAQSLEGQVGWMLRGKRIFFTTLAGQNLVDLGVSSVDVDAISMSEGVVGQEKPLPLPSNIADELVRDVVAFFMPMMQPMKDTLNDNSPNPKPLKS